MLNNNTECLTIYVISFIFLYCWLIIVSLFILLLNYLILFHDYFDYTLNFLDVCLFKY